MFKKISLTSFRPPKPVLIWDGDCLFCHYWVTKLKNTSGGKIDFRPFQEIHHIIADISEEDFKDAVRLIDTDGHVYNGPETVYWWLHSARNFDAPLKKYRKPGYFRQISDRIYVYVSRHRSLMLKLSHIFFGENPVRTRHYWIFYLLVACALVSANKWKKPPDGSQKTQ